MFESLVNTSTVVSKDCTLVSFIVAGEREGACEGCSEIEGENVSPAARVGRIVGSLVG
jgi:hypothetical protein